MFVFVPPWSSRYCRCSFFDEAFLLKQPPASRDRCQSNVVSMISVIVSMSNVSSSKTIVSSINITIIIIISSSSSRSSVISPFLNRPGSRLNCPRHVQQEITRTHLAGREIYPDVVHG